MIIQSYHWYDHIISTSRLFRTYILLWYDHLIQNILIVPLVAPPAPLQCSKVMSLYLASIDIIEGCWRANFISQCHIQNDGRRRRRPKSGYLTCLAIAAGKNRTLSPSLSPSPPSTFFFADAIFDGTNISFGEQKIRSWQKSRRVGQHRATSAQRKIQHKWEKKSQL